MLEMEKIMQHERKVKKNKLFVAILTKEYRIEGEVYLVPGSRLTDLVNDTTNEHFVPMTNAEIIPLGKNADVTKVDFLAVNKSCITLTYPLDS
ncbi:MAG: hypothetical protein NTZ34_07015 [Chloroflexi bacterium]|nr:hypothetical protein [Chloroflexota bacterium]